MELFRRRFNATGRGSAGWSVVQALIEPRMGMDSHGWMGKGWNRMAANDTRMAANRGRWGPADEWVGFRVGWFGLPTEFREGPEEGVMRFSIL